MEDPEKDQRQEKLEQECEEKREEKHLEDLEMPEGQAEDIRGGARARRRPDR